MTNPYASPEADLTKVSSGDEGVSLRVIEILKETRKWASRTRILLGLMVLATLVSASYFLRTQIGQDGSEAPFGDVNHIAQTVTDIGWYLLRIATSMVLAICAHRYVIAISKLLEDGQLLTLEGALSVQQNFWRILFFTCVAEIGANFLFMIMRGVLGWYFL